MKAQFYEPNYSFLLCIRLFDGMEGGDDALVSSSKILVLLY